MWCPFCPRFWRWTRIFSDGSTYSPINDESTQYYTSYTINDHSVNDSTIYHQDGNRGTIFNNGFFGNYLDVTPHPATTQCYVPTNGEIGGFGGGQGRPLSTLSANEQEDVVNNPNHVSGRGRYHVDDSLLETPRTSGTYHDSDQALNEGAQAGDTDRLSASFKYPTADSDLADNHPSHASVRSSSSSEPQRDEAPSGPSPASALNDMTSFSDGPVRVNFTVPSDDDKSRAQWGHPAAASTDKPNSGPMKFQVMTKGEIYAQHMHRLGHGLPCWRPTASIVPGDVGTFSLTQGFTKVFNIWEEEWPGYLTEMPPRGTTLQSDFFPMGDVIVSGASAGLRWAEGASYVEDFEFQSQSETGAVLVCMRPADLEKLEDVDALRTFLIQNARAVYQKFKAKNVVPLGENESVYIIIGSIKCDGWALAAYQDVIPGQGFSLSKLSAGDNKDDEGRIYVWVDSERMAATRLWPHTVEEARLHKGKRHCLFLRGFKLDVSPQFHEGMSSASDNEDARGSAGDNSGHAPGGGGNNHPRSGGSKVPEVFSKCG